MRLKKLTRFIPAAIVVVAAAMSLSIGCATSSGSLPLPEQLTAPSRAGAEDDIASMRRGRALVVTECATCHRLYWPQECSPEEWERIIRDMGRSASLGEGQVRDMQLYMKAASGVQYEGSNFTD
jgi:cytochrome c5